MKLTAHELRLIRRLDRPAHQFGFHLAAAIVMLLGGAFSGAQGLRGHRPADLWMGCLVAAIGIFWTERLVYNRIHQRLIAKLIRVRCDGDQPAEHQYHSN